MDGIWDWTIGPFINLLGNYFWVVLLFIGITLVYLKTRSFGPTVMALIVGASTLAVYIPGDVQIILLFAIVIGITLVFFRLLVRWRGYGG